MPTLLRKYWKRFLLLTLVVAAFPVSVTALLWWDSRPRHDAKVSVGYLKTEIHGGSNAVTFVVTNESSFPVIYVVFCQTQDTSQTEVWMPPIPTQPFSTWQLASNSMLSTSVVSVGVFSTNRWKLRILGSGSSPDAIWQAREWVAWHLRGLDHDWAWWLHNKVSRSREPVDASGPEMLGPTPAP